MFVYTLISILLINKIITTLKTKGHTYIRTFIFNTYKLTR